MGSIGPATGVVHDATQACRLEALETYSAWPVTRLIGHDVATIRLPDGSTATARFSASERGDDHGLLFPEVARNAATELTMAPNADARAIVLARGSAADALPGHYVLPMTLVREGSADVEPLSAKLLGESELLGEAHPAVQGVMALDRWGHVVGRDVRSAADKAADPLDLATLLDAPVDSRAARQAGNAINADARAIQVIAELVAATKGKDITSVGQLGRAKFSIVSEGELIGRPQGYASHKEAIDAIKASGGKAGVPLGVQVDDATRYIALETNNPMSNLDPARKFVVKALRTYPLGRKEMTASPNQTNWIHPHRDGMRNAGHSSSHAYDLEA